MIDLSDEADNEYLFVSSCVNALPFAGAILPPRHEIVTTKCWIPPSAQGKPRYYLARAYLLNSMLDFDAVANKWLHPIPKIGYSWATDIIGAIKEIIAEGHDPNTMMINDPDRFYTFTKNRALGDERPITLAAFLNLREHWVHALELL